MGLARASFWVPQSRHPLADRRDDRARRLHDGLASLNLVSGLSRFIGGNRTCETLNSQQFWAWRSRSRPVATRRSNKVCLVQAQGPQGRSSPVAMLPLGPSSAAQAILHTAKPTQTAVNNIPGAALRSRHFATIGAHSAGGRFVFNASPVRCQSPGRTLYV